MRSCGRLGWPRQLVAKAECPERQSKIRFVTEICKADAWRGTFRLDEPASPVWSKCTLNLRVLAGLLLSGSSVEHLESESRQRAVSDCGLGVLTEVRSNPTALGSLDNPLVGQSSAALLMQQSSAPREEKSRIVPSTLAAVDPRLSIGILQGLTTSPCRRARLGECALMQRQKHTCLCARDLGPKHRFRLAKGGVF